MTPERSRSAKPAGEILSEKVAAATDESRDPHHRFDDRAGTKVKSEWLTAKSGPRPAETKTPALFNSAQRARAYFGTFFPKWNVGEADIRHVYCGFLSKSWNSCVYTQSEVSLIPTWVETLKSIPPPTP